MTKEERAAANAAIAAAMQEWADNPGRSDCVALALLLGQIAARAIKAERDKPRGTDCGDMGT